MADVKHCTASPINDFEGFLHIFYCRIKNFTELLTEKLLLQVGWQGRVQNNRNSPHDVRSPDCRVLTQMYLPNLFFSRFWRAVVSFTAIVIDLESWCKLTCSYKMYIYQQMLNIVMKVLRKFWHWNLGKITGVGSSIDFL
jgi:hypothetical protein